MSSAPHVVGTSGGGKHVLGLREGATENAAACKALLANLIERRLPTERTLLFVIDGAKALHKALSDIFGECAPIQRCREHKKRNVTGRDYESGCRRSTFSLIFPRPGATILTHAVASLDRALGALLSVMLSRFE